MMCYLCFDRIQTPRDSKPKPKKKPKKTKFKSLKKGALASESKSMKEELQIDRMSIDDEFISSLDLGSPNSAMQKKRKKPRFTTYVEEEKPHKKSKKTKRAAEICASDSDDSLLGLPFEHAELKQRESMVESEQRPPSRSKMGGKISITSMPVKRVLTIKPEKVKKSNAWTKDGIPSADFWLPQEDAILCAVVHEYGSNWSLVSDTLYGMTSGGSYRGRYRHPVHCCERFRELVQKYVLSTADNANHERGNNTASGKSLLKVTEVKMEILTC